MKKKNSKKNKKVIIGIIIGILAICIILFLVLKVFRNTKEYTVTFDTNGGSLIASVIVKENETVSKPKDPTKNGYIFAGWYLDDEMYDFDTKIISDITLEAYWDSDGFALSSSKLNLVIGSEQKLKVELFNDSLTEDDLVWISSDESIVTIDENGNLKALKEGTVTITVKSKDSKYSASCTVTVTSTEIEVESVSIGGSSQVTVGSSIKLTATLNPENATSTDVTWKSSDTSIATVDSNGNVRGVKAGTVTITVTTSNGKTATKNITVKEKNTSQNDNKNSNSSSNSNSNSNNTGSSSTVGGQTQQTPSTPSPQPTPSTVPVSGVSINSGDRTMTVGDSATLSATVSPSNATNKGISWSSSNPGVVTVDGNGNIRAVGAGTATITVTTADGGKTSTITITVKAVESVYVLHLKAIVQEGTNGVAQYSCYITKDGATTTDYAAFSINGNVYRKSSTVSAQHVQSGGNSANITLSDGSVKNLSVIIE